MLRLETLLYVIEVAKAGSINKAADNLYLSQPYLSSCLKDLERELGVVLFNRSSKGVSLTTAGEMFLSYVYDIEHSLSNIYRLKEKFSTHKAALRVVSMYSFTFLDLFHCYKQIHSADSCEFSYSETGNSMVPEEVKNGNADLGFFYLAPQNESSTLQMLKKYDLLFTELCQEPLYALVSTRNPLARQSSVSLEELSNFSLLIEKQKESIVFPCYTQPDSQLSYHFSKYPLSFDNNRSLMYFLTKSDNCFSFGQRCLNLSNPFVLSNMLTYIPISNGSLPLKVGFLEKNSARSKLHTEFIKYVQNFFESYCRDESFSSL